MRHSLALITTIAALGTGAGSRAVAQTDGLAGPWRAVVDLAGGPLRFALEFQRSRSGWQGKLCNGPSCDQLSAVSAEGDSLRFEMADYDAAITASWRGDSLVGYYRNVGNRGPRVISFRAARGEWPRNPAGPRLQGSWDATFDQGGRKSPRVFLIGNGGTGIEAAYHTNSGGYGLFWGSATPSDSFDIGRFDGAFVYRITGKLDGDTLRGIFHAGLRTQTPWTAVRSTGRPHLTAPRQVTAADTSRPFTFAFPDLEGRLVTQDDPRFRDKVVIVDIFGSWCPTCHFAAPAMLDLYREFRGQGLEIVGLAYEVTGDSAIDNRQVRRFRDKFGITWPLLLAGLNETAATAATLPQLYGFSAYPTKVFLGRDGRVREVHAGFLGPEAGPLYDAQLRDLRELVADLLARP